MNQLFVTSQAAGVQRNLHHGKDMKQCCKSVLQWCEAVLQCRKCILQWCEAILQPCNAQCNGARPIYTTARGFLQWCEA